jgi:hypothetical protein
MSTTNTNQTQASPGPAVPDKRRIVRMDATIWGITMGFLFGLGLFAATIILVVRGGEEVGKHLGLLRHFYPGYSVSYVGSLVGFAYAFATAFIVMWLFVNVYNFVAQKREGPSA